METPTTKPSFETAINTKHRGKRLFQMIGIISPLIIFVLTLVLAYITTDIKTLLPVVISGTALFFMVISIATLIDSETYLSEYIPFESTIGTIASIITIMVWLAQYSTPLRKVLLVIMRDIPKIIGGIAILALALLILFGGLGAIYTAIKWISWNGYSKDFIAITKSGNIKKFNKVQSIPEKLDVNANLTLVKTTLAKYKPELDEAGKNKLFW